MYTRFFPASANDHRAEIRVVAGLAAILSWLCVVGPADADAQTRSSSFTYDTSTGLLTSEVIEPNDANYRIETDYSYDSYGHRVTATVSGQGILSRNTAAGYDSAKGQFQTSATNALQQTEIWTYDSRTGLPLTHTDLNGLVTSWSYDGFGRVTLETRPDGGTTSYGYVDCSASGSDCSRVAGSVFAAWTISRGPDGSTVTSPKITIYFDALSRQIAVETDGFDGSKTLALTQYDEKGNVHQVSRPYFAAGGIPKWTINTYDALGRITRNDTPNGGYAVYAYHGLTISATNDKSQITTTTKNAEGQVATVLDAAGGATSYTYDAYNNLLTVTDPASHQIVNTFDVLGRKLSSSDPDIGLWTYTFDVLGEILTQSDAKGQTTSLTYDLVGHMTSRSENGQYSTWTFGSSASNHNVGKLIESKACADSGCGTVISDRTIAYDQYGRPWQSVLSVDGVNQSYTTTYESGGDPQNGGRPKTLTYPSGLTTQNVYNTNGYLSQIRDASSGTAYWTANTRDAELHLLTNTAGNGVVTTRYFDSNTGLTTGVRAGPIDSVAAFDYQYDTLGNLIYRSDNLLGTFEYACYDDSLNRLTEFAVGSRAVTNCHSPQNHKSVNYDSLGNISNKSDTGSFGYGTRPHAVASVTGTVNGVVNPSFSYDANGNMTGGAGRTMTYTSFNMASSIQQGSTTFTLAYDADHARVKMVGSSGTTYYVNDPISGAMAEKNISGVLTTWTDYLTADGHLVAMKTSGASSAVRYIVTDHLGSVAVATDESGSTVERDAYDAWGKRRNLDGSDRASCSTPASITTHGFTGHEQIDAACLVNANARIYDPALGRFMAADTIIPDPYDSQSYNRYSYIRNRPLSATDPTGHDDTMETVTITGSKYTDTGLNPDWLRSQQTIWFDQFKSSGDGAMGLPSVGSGPASAQDAYNNIKSVIDGARGSSEQNRTDSNNRNKRSVLISFRYNSDGTVTGTYSIVDGDAEGWNQLFDALGVPNFGGSEIGSVTNGAGQPKIDGTFIPRGGVETLRDTAGMITAETLSMDKGNDPNAILKARSHLAHQRINAERKFGATLDKRAGAMSPIYSGPSWESSLTATINAAMEDALGIDPTNGALYYNMRTIGQDKNMKDAAPSWCGGCVMHTRDGPFNSWSVPQYIYTWGPPL